jgi:hypothetical protein
MKKIVFYSWQSDLPNSTNRGFVEKALEKAIKLVATDETIVIDRDTAGVGGSPDISTTIFDKIVKANVFVADVSIINKGSKFRPTPNPNVLLELGYAIKALTLSNIISVVDVKYGSPEKLPFDLKMKKTVTYNSSKDKTSEMSILVSKLKSQLELIFAENSAKEDIQPSVIEIIRGQKADRIGGVRNYMKVLSKDLDSFYPGDGMLNTHEPDPEYDQKIIDALEKTTGIMATFRSVVDEIAIYDDSVALKEVFNSFKPIIENFDHKKGFAGGTTHKAKYDYYKFLGNEMFVILTSILLREQKWDLLKLILEDTIVIDNVNGHKAEAVDYTYFSDYTISFDLRKTRLKSNRADLRYDLLMERRKNETDHTSGAIEEYTSADLFLFLKGESKVINSTDVSFDWRPWSLLHFELPRFILLAKSKSFANGIAKALGVQHAQDFQILLSNKPSNISKMYSRASIIWQSPIDANNIQEIGSR